MRPEPYVPAVRSCRNGGSQDTSRDRSVFGAIRLLYTSMSRPRIGLRGPRLRLVRENEPDAVAQLPRSDATDEQLIASVRAGDDSAARAFCERVRPRVDITIRSLLGGSDSERDDLAQSAVLTIIRGIHRYRGDCSLDGWVGLVAARVVYNEIRRRRRERRIFTVSPDAHEEIASPVNLSREIVARDLAGYIRRHVDQLDEEKAWTLLLHDVCGFTLDEIATITNASVAAAQKRLTRGRSELAEKIADDPELAELVSKVES